MQFRELSVKNAFEVIPQQHLDDRGLFLEQLRVDHLAQYLGHIFDVKQVNTSVSHKGVVRGIHYADVPPGQAKYVTVPQGSVLDFVVDIRVGSPTFGHWDSLEINSEIRNAVYIGEGLGHAFVALEENTVVTYLVSEVFNPSAEHGINPLDSTLGLCFPEELDLRFSPKDTLAPDFETSLDLGLLPVFDDVNQFYSLLGSRGTA